MVGQTCNLLCATAQTVIEFLAPRYSIEEEVASFLFAGLRVCGQEATRTRP